MTNIATTQKQKLDLLTKTNYKRAMSDEDIARGDQAFLGLVAFFVVLFSVAVILF